MARLIGPDSGDRLTVRPGGSGYARSAEVVVYVASSGTTLANILTESGAAISGSTLTTDDFGLIPLFQFPDGVDTVYVEVAGGPRTAVYARYDDRVDGVAARVAALEAGTQAIDPDLTAIAALDSSTAGVLSTDGSGWIRKTYAQLKTALALVKGDVGLGNVDNTADTAKPISTATQTALDLKLSTAAASAAYQSKAAPTLLRRECPGVPGLPTTMATPPTVTVGTANAASVITSAKTWDAGLLTYSGAEMGYGASFPDNIGYSPMANNGAANTAAAYVTPPWRVSFFSDAPKIEIYNKGVTTAYRVLIDGQYVTAGGAATVTRSSSGNGFRDLLDFTSAGGRTMRRYDIDLAPGSRLYGITTGPIDTLVPAPRRGLRTIVVGDSFTEGTGAAQAFQSWSHQLCQLLGTEMWSSGSGGTGYLNPGSGGRVKFRDRLANDVLRNSPDYIIWAGGINDYAYAGATAASIAAELTACLTAAVAALPNVKQIVVGPFWRNGPSTIPNAMLDAKDAMKAAALAFGAMWVDPVELAPTPLAFATTLASSASAGATTLSTAARPGSGNNGALMTVEIGTGATRERQFVTAWTGGGPYSATTKALTYAHSAGEAVTVVGNPIWIGTGRSGSLQADGNSDVLVGGSDGSDPTHPTQAGHDAIARAIYGQIARQLVG